MSGQAQLWTLLALLTRLAAGTFTLEFLALSHRTGNPEYGEKAEAIMRTLHERHPNRVRAGQALSSLGRLLSELEQLRDTLCALNGLDRRLL